MTDYCATADLYAHGLPRGSTPNPGRVLYQLADDTCMLDDHGFVTGDPISFIGGGDGGLPTGLTAGTTYYAQRETEATFKVRATADGAALVISDATDPVVVISPLPTAEAIEWASAIVDDMLTAHDVPLDPVPEIVKFTTAELAAGKLAAMKGSASVSLSAVVDAAGVRLRRWATGVAVPGADTAAETRANLAVTGTAAADPRGWRCFGRL